MVRREPRIPSSYALDPRYEAFVQAQLASGRYNNSRYNNKREVLRDALRRLEERERRLAALDTAIVRGIADAAANDVEDAEAMFDALEAKYRRMAAERNSA